MNMLQVIKAGAAKAIADDPCPLAISPTMQAMEKAAAELAAKGPLHADIPTEELLPGVTHYGRIFDQPKYTAAFLARQKARSGK
jgi:hypothetical protein